MSDAPPLFVRRLRALWRKIGPASARSIGRGVADGSVRRIKGFVDGFVAGEIRGWAVDRLQPGRRVHMIALEDGRVVAEGLADQLRADLVRGGFGDGRHAFRLRLPAALLDGERRRVEIRAIVGGEPVQLKSGKIEIKNEPLAFDAPAAGGSQPSLAALDAGTAIVEPSPPRPAMAVWPAPDGEPEPSADGDALAGAGGLLVRLGAPGAVIGTLAEAHTVIFARADDRIDPAAIPLLLRSTPLSDVLTWDGEHDASCRPEARPLGLLLGETLGGAFAVRGHVLRLMGEEFARALEQGDVRRAELLLASRRELRWAHLPGTITLGAGGDPAPSPASSGVGLKGYRWAEPEAGRPARLIPAPSPSRISIALWPAWTAAANASLASLLAQAPADAEIEVLASAAGIDEARAATESLRRDEIPVLTVRAVDDPADGTPGEWLAALAAAASGEVVIVCQAGVQLLGGTGALEEIAAWASSPLAGAVTVPIRRDGAPPLSGLALERSDAGWSARSAHAQDLEGRSRPVLGAPASFLAIGRDKLAMVGGAAAERLPAGGVDLDLALKLRRLGVASILLGGLGAEAVAGTRPAGEVFGAALAAFDPDELAAAAAAYPAPRG